MCHFTIDKVSKRQADLEQKQNDEYKHLEALKDLFDEIRKLQNKEGPFDEQKDAIFKIVVSFAQEENKRHKTEYFLIGEFKSDELKKMTVDQFIKWQESTLKKWCEYSSGKKYDKNEPSH